MTHIQLEASFLIFVLERRMLQADQGNRAGKYHVAGTHRESEQEPSKLSPVRNNTEVLPREGPCPGSIHIRRILMRKSEACEIMNVGCMQLDY